MINYHLDKNKVCLLVVDVQEKIFKEVERSCEVMYALQKIIKGFQIMKLPIIVSEQYPEGLGSTVSALKNLLGQDAVYRDKTTFSCFADEQLKEDLLPFSQVVLVGVEAHVCILQTAKDLLKAGKQVVILNDAISSRFIYDFSTAIAEASRAGARISSVETILFELLKSSKSPFFKEMIQLIK
ncbi:MAG TPA: isochorismatase family protein [Parachlamydiaceae bacterium]|nr:isochorismatase family protein [Parachlamydiaceae bacterium]